MQDFHFYAAHVGGWGTGNNINDALNKALETVRKGLGQGKHRLPVEVWYVPVPATESYQINYYSPQVEGAVPIMVLMYNKDRFDLPTAEEDEQYGFKFGEDLAKSG